MSEYQIKLAAIREYQDALHLKMINEDLCNLLVGILGQLSRYYQKNGMEMPDEVSRLMEKAAEALDIMNDSLNVTEPAPKKE